MLNYRLGTVNEKDTLYGSYKATPAQWPHLFYAGQLSDDLVAVALIDEEALSLEGVLHLHRVLGHQRVEEGVVLLRHRSCSNIHTNSSWQFCAS